MRNCNCKGTCQKCRNAYALAIMEGRATNMTLSEYLDSIEGNDGNPGIQGLNNFQLWLEEPGNEGKSIEEFWDFLRGDNGNPGQARVTSYVFKRANSAPDKPIGGNFFSPKPLDTTWTDGPSSGDGNLYMSYRVFTSDGLPPQQVEWSVPVIVADSDYLDIEWSSVDSNPGTPLTNPENWSNEADENSIWMALRKFSNGVWEPWSIIRVKGETGEQGKPGDTLEIRYQKNGSFTVPPSLDNAARNPTGWELTAPTIITGEYLWQIQATIDQDTNLLVGTWSTPIRTTGERGENGVQGPSAIFRGDWKSDQQYTGNNIGVDIVKYLVNGKGYIARVDAGEIPVGTVPTNTTYWNEVPVNIDALFTDFLFAYSAYIQDLTVANLQTALSGQRMEITDGDNRLKFYDGTNTFQRVEVGIFDVDSVTGLGEPIVVEVSGIGSRTTNDSSSFNFILSDKGLKINEGQMYWGFKTISTNPVNRVYIYGKLVVKGNVAVDSIFSDNYQVWDNDAKEIKPGYTGTINGAKFVNGICVGPA